MTPASRRAKSGAMRFHADAPAFTDPGLDRADALRRAPDKIAALLARPDARVHPFWRASPYLVRGDAQAVAAAFSGPEAPQPDAFTVFLGLDGDAGVFARSYGGDAPPLGLTAALGAGDFPDLRRAIGAVAPRDAAILGTARSLFAWHHKHPFCANCGGATQSALAGWKRVCGACGAEHFPRVDPVVIMRIEHDERVLLGRQASWPPEMWSCLAGYVEPGETLEDAVRRETFEEAGVEVGAVAYVESQPWPFPSSMMIGMAGQALTHDIRIDPHELEDARWFTRDEARRMMSGGDAVVPRAAAIAYHLLRRWTAT